MVGDTDLERVRSGIKGLSPRHRISKIFNLQHELSLLTCPSPGVPPALDWVGARRLCFLVPLIRFHHRFSLGWNFQVGQLAKII